jgi:hypothetical protein
VGPIILINSDHQRPDTSISSKVSYRPKKVNGKGSKMKDSGVCSNFEVSLIELPAYNSKYHLDNWLLILFNPVYTCTQ